MSAAHEKICKISDLHVVIHSAMAKQNSRTDVLSELMSFGLLDDHWFNLTSVYLDLGALSMPNFKHQKHNIAITVRVNKVSKLPVSFLYVA